MVWAWYGQFCPSWCRMSLKKMYVSIYVCFWNIILYYTYCVYFKNNCHVKMGCYFVKSKLYIWYWYGILQVRVYMSKLPSLFKKKIYFYMILKDLRRRIIYTFEETFWRGTFLWHSKDITKGFNMENSL